MSASSCTIDESKLVELYSLMSRIRAFEERVAQEFKTGDMPSFVHMYIGEESIAAGVGIHIDNQDYVTSTHRGHGHAIAKGCELGPMMAELYGKEGGICRGRGGSMHIADFTKGMLGANAIVGGGISLATGGAFAARTRRSDQVAVSFFGDGAVNQGVLYESLNLAAIWQLPVVYICENNGWAETTPFSYATGVPNAADRAAGFGLPGVVVDSSDAVETATVLGEAIARAREGGGPTFIEVKTYRFNGHFEGDPQGYRSREIRKSIRERDPIPPVRQLILERGLWDEAALTEESEALRAELDEAVAFAKASPLPDPCHVADYMYVDYSTSAP